MAKEWQNQYQPKHPFMKWMDERLPLPRLIYNSIGSGYEVPKNLNFLWNFGVAAGLFLMLQVITGIVLVMHYAGDIKLAFDSVEHIMRDVNYGWLFRYLHSNGASFFFIVIYIHFLRGLYYGSYKPPREMVWILGVMIFLVMMATAFMGYVLPWGQMSRWGAVVITGLFSAIPLIGETVQTWLVGGPSIDGYTLTRFFSLHYLLPFAIIGLVILHIWALHLPGSGNPTGVEVKSKEDTIPFHPYYTAKDGFGIGLILIAFSVLVFFDPDRLGHPDNYIPANAMATPAHIVPEWYFWPFYAILRAFTLDFLGIPAKLWGVMAMFASILIWFFLPWLDRSPTRSARYRPTYRFLFWLLIVDLLILALCGSAPAEEPWVRISQIASAWYFLHFMILVPLVSLFENPLPAPDSISKASV